MSPTLSGSSEIQRFERSDAIKIHNEIILNLYTGPSHSIYSSHIVAWAMDLWTTAMGTVEPPTPVQEVGVVQGQDACPTDVCASPVM